MTSRLCKWPIVSKTLSLSETQRNLILIVGDVQINSTIVIG